MKKKDINTFGIVNPSLDDYMLVKTPTGFRYVERRTGSRYMESGLFNIAGGNEHELIAFSGLFGITNGSTGRTAVYLSDSHGVKLINSTDGSFGDKESGTQAILVYRKTTNGPLYIKNNTGSSFSYRYYFY